MTTTLLVLGLVATAAAAAAIRLWPAHDPEVVEHEHHGLDADHDHLHGAVVVGRWHRHAHPYRIDDLHARWPAVVRR